MGQKERFLEIDALRGLAAFTVVLFHFTMQKPESRYGFFLGATGVDLFFIISGFVIFMTLDKTEKATDFIVSRFSRLYPVYWACVSFTAILIFAKDSDALVGRVPLFKAWLANMTMFQLYLKIQDLDGPYWTMIVEMLFYLIMLIVFLFNKIKHLEKIFSFLLVLVIFFNTNIFKENFDWLHARAALYLPILHYFPLFFAGVLFYKIREKITSFRVAMLIGCFFSQINIFEHGYRNAHYISVHSYIAMLGIYFLIFFIYIKNGLKFLVNKPSIFLGSISYPLYLIHQHVGTKLLIPYFLENIHSSFWLALLFAVTTTIAIAFLIHKFIEYPAMDFIRKRYKSRKPKELPIPFAG